MRSPRVVQGRSMERFREVEAWAESYFFCSSVLLALASLGSHKEQQAACAVLRFTSGHPERFNVVIDQ